MENLQSKNFPKNEYLEIVELEKNKYNMKVILLNISQMQ